MIIILPLLILISLTIFGMRLRSLMGWHLREDKESPHILDYQSKSKGTVYVRHLGIAIKHGIPFIIRKERWYHRYLKQLGIASEIQIGCKDFDTRYFITTDFPDHLEAQLQSTELKEHLTALFALPVKALYANHQRIWCVITEPDMSIAAKYFLKHTKLLRAIAKASQAAVALPAPRKLRPYAFAALCIHTAALTIGISLVVTLLAQPKLHILDHTHWFALTFMIALIGALLWLQLLYHYFRKSSWLGWVLADFVLFGLAAVFCLSLFSLHEANVHFPQPPATLFSKRVVEKFCELKCEERCGKRCRRYSNYPYRTDVYCNPAMRQKIYQEKIKTDKICQSEADFVYNVQVEHWERKGVYSFIPSETLFDTMRKNQQVSIPVHEGALGLKWMADDEIQPQ